MSNKKLILLEIGRLIEQRDDMYKTIELSSNQWEIEMIRTMAVRLTNSIDNLQAILKEMI